MDQIKRLCDEFKIEINDVIEYKNDELHIDLSCKNIGPVGCKYLEKINCHTLYLGWNNIGPEGCKYLEKINCHTLNLDGNNNIGPEGCKYLEKINCHTIYLAGNNIPNYETIESEIKKRYIERINIITKVLNDFLINDLINIVNQYHNFETNKSES